MIATSAQAACSPPFGSGASPQNAVYAGGLFPLIGGYPFHSQCLGVERVGQKMLKNPNLVPSFFLHSLCDSHLQPSDFTPGFIPVDGIPLVGVVLECTSLMSRHLHSLLQRFCQLSRNETPVGRLHARSPGLKPAGFGVEPCFMLYLPAFPEAFASSNLSSPPLHRRALRFAFPELLRAKDGVTTFRTVDPKDDLGATSTPGVLRFRTGS